MVTISEAAKPELARFFKIHELSPIRIWLDASCKSLTLNMELDEENPGADQVFNVGEYRFLVENELIPIVMPLTIDVFDGEGVRFAHEVHPGEIAYDYWTSVRTLEAIEHRNAFGFNWDPSHMMWQEQ